MRTTYSSLLRPFAVTKLQPGCPASNPSDQERQPQNFEPRINSNENGRGHACSSLSESLRLHESSSRLTRSNPERPRKATQEFRTTNRLHCTRIKPRYY